LQRFVLCRFAGNGYNPEMNECVHRSHGSSIASSASTNAVLTALYNVLKFECNIQAHTLGCSVRGLDDVHKRVDSYQTYLLKTRNMPLGGSDSDAYLYFVSADLRQCYDRIDQKRLFRRASELLTHDHYVVQKNTVIHSLPSVQRTRTRVSANDVRCTSRVFRP
jgi:mRNA-degrading endonuclease YafQ of YafQ-DinJ toxin-antitoxin module